MKVKSKNNNRFYLLIFVALLGIFLWFVGEKFISGEVKSLNVTTPGTKVELKKSKWVPQTYNNCGPAATSMLLQHFGINVNQTEVKNKIRTNPKDANVFSQEIVDYLRTNHYLESKVMVNGDLPTIKKLIANGFYVMVQIWLHPNEDIGHNSVIRGYDDALGVLIADDPYLGVGVKYKYKDFESGQWKAFNREYIPVYRKEQEETLKAILGTSWNQENQWRSAINLNSQDVANNPKDMYAWFNLGSSYFSLGEYTKAKEAFEKSKSLGWPRRMLWYQYQPIQTYNALGEYQKALTLINIGLRNNDSFAELHFEAAVAHKGLGDRNKALIEVRKALQLSPEYKPAVDLLKNI